MVTMRDWALTLVDHGLPVFPCKPRGKTPLTPHGFKDATTSTDIVDRWWWRWPDANPGLPTGAVSGLVVLDIDPRHDGVRTFHEWTEQPAVAAMWMSVSPVVVLTGGGGYHHYYRHPGRAVPCLSGRLPGHPALPGVDVRGDGGYVLAPGARTERYYRPMQPLDPATLDPWPDALTPRPAPVAAVGPFGRLGGASRHGYEGIHRLLTTATVGERHNLAHWALRRMHEHGVPAERAETAVADTLAPSGFPRRQVSSIVRSIWRQPG